VTVPDVSVEDCGEVLEDIYDTNLCAGGVAGKDSCFGDGVGPMTRSVNSNEILYGVVSWGLSLCAIGYPGVYTAVSMYRDWIEDNSGLTLGNTDYDAGSSDDSNTYIILGTLVGVIVVLVLVLVGWWMCSASEKLYSQRRRVEIISMEMASNLNKEHGKD